MSRGAGSCMGSVQYHRVLYSPDSTISNNSCLIHREVITKGAKRHGCGMGDQVLIPHRDMDI